MASRLPDSEKVPNDRAMSAQSSAPTAMYQARHVPMILVAVGEAPAVSVGGMGRAADEKSATQ